MIEICSGIMLDFLASYPGSVEEELGYEAKISTKDCHIYYQERKKAGHGKVGCENKPVLTSVPMCLLPNFQLL